MLPILRISYSSMFITTTDILRTLANFDILPEWASFKYFRENIIGFNSFDDFAKLNPLILTNQTENKRLLSTITNPISSALKNETETGPKLPSIGIESSSIIVNLGSLGDVIVGMVLFSLAI